MNYCHPIFLFAQATSQELSVHFGKRCGWHKACHPILCGWETTGNPKFFVNDQCTEHEFRR